MARRLVLFDVDGTLLLTGGAGVRAFDRAMAIEFDSGMNLKIISPSGMTDPAIFRAVFAQNRGRPPTSEEERRLFVRYLEFLKEEVKRSSDFRVLTGVRELLLTLADRESFLLGLGTGNVEEGARIKLKRAELDAFFAFGGFGSDSADRAELLRVAVERARRILPDGDGIEAVFVVGDTPRDVAAGKAIGARTLAVASGFCSASVLAAEDPDLVVASLGDRDRLLKWLQS